MKKTIMLVDDDDSLREVMLFELEKEGYTVIPARDGEEALLKTFQINPQLIITDLKMPKMDGFELLERVKKSNPEIAVIVMTAFGEIEIAVKAIKAGAYDFIPKPYDRDHFKIVVAKALDTIDLKYEVADLNRKIQGFDKEIIYRSTPMKNVIELIDNVAGSDANILISGESGTGKELVAKMIHTKSERRNQPFIAVNCAAIPKELIESELFGHVKGAFTGAMSDKKGKFLLADGGTIFLDEIGELPLNLQPRLLRVLQERSVDAIGSEKTRAINVRVISATNRDLQKEIEEMRFREDLYYRLNVFPIHIPPLRERVDDITILVDYFIKKYGNGKQYTLSDGLLSRLTNNIWKGNVRELENMCQRLVILAKDENLTEELLYSFSDQKSESILSEENFILPENGLSLLELEKNIIMKSLKKFGFNRTKAADYLSIPRHIFIYRMEKYGLNEDDNES